MPHWIDYSSGAFLFMQQQITAIAAVEIFLVDCQARKLSKRTLEYYEESLTPFVAYCKSNLSEISTVDIRQYMISLQERGLTAHSQHSHARALRAFFNFCVVEELLDESPFRRVKMPKLPKLEPKAFSDDEVSKILDACKTLRDRALVLLLLDTGIRIEEASKLLIGDVDKETVTVRSGKGAKYRVVFVGAKTRKAILKYLGTDRKSSIPASPLFVTYDAPYKALTTSGLMQIMKRLRMATGIKHLLAHTFRRTFAIASLRSGMAVHVLAKLMGHSDIQVLRAYLDITKDDLKQQSAQHGVVDHLK